MIKSVGRPHIPLLVTSFIIAVTLWVYVQAQTLDFQTVPGSVVVKTTGLSPDFIATDLPATWPISAIIPAEHVKEISLQDLTGYIDMTSVKETGLHKLWLRVVAPPSIQDVLSRKAYQIPVEIEKKTEKSFPVEVRTVGNLADPAESYDTASTIPDRITYTGPEAQMARIAHVRAQLDLRQIDPDHPEQTFPLAPEPLDADDRPVSHVSTNVSYVMVQPSLMSAAVTRILFVQPSLVGQPATGYEVLEYHAEPDKVLVRGTSLMISRLSTIHTHLIDITGMKHSSVVTVSLESINGVKPLRKMPVKVVITLRRQTLPRLSPTPPPASPGNSFPERVPPLDVAPRLKRPASSTPLSGRG